MRPSRLRITTGGGSGFKSVWAIGSNSIIGAYAMKKNVASQVIGAAMVSATDGSAFTGSVTVYVTGNGGAQAVGSVGAGACTHEGNGFHTYAPAQAETNYDHIGFTFIGTGAVPATVQVFPTFPQTGDSFARIGAPAGASIAADIATVDTVVDSILVDTAEIGAAGAGLTAVPWNAAWDAQVESEVTDALNAYDPPTKAELDSGLAALNDLDAAGVATSVWNAATASYGSAGSYGLLIETNLDAAVSTASAPTAAAVADAVWDEALSGHLGAGSTGEALNAAGAAGDPWTTTLPGAYTGSQAGKMLSDIITDTAEIGAAGAGLTAVPWNASWDAQVESEVTDALNAYDPPTKADLDSAVAPLATAANLATVAGYLDTEIAAILADTNELQTDWTNGGRLDLLIDAIKLVTDALPNSGALTDLATAAALATVDGNVDLVLEDTTTTIPGLIAALNNLAASDILTTALVESYAADGAAPTLSQAIFLIQQFLYERATAGTTVTVKKLDGSTTAATLTLDSGTTPTSITRST